MGADLYLHGIRTEPIRLANRLHRFLTGLRVKSIDEHDPIEVIGFVLHAPREQVASLERYRLSMHVHALGDHAACALAFERQIRNRQAALFTVLLFVGRI